MTRLFLDTEWADTMASELVSLALVSEDGLHRYYAEIAPLPESPTDFVQNVVYPLLERGESAMRSFDLTRSLRRFLLQTPGPVSVLFDYAIDGVLFRYALEGFESDADHGPCPEVAMALVAHNDIRLQTERYFMSHPEASSRRHHAAVDADALRWAFLEALRAAVTRDSSTIEDSHIQGKGPPTESSTSSLGSVEQTKVLDALDVHSGRVKPGHFDFLQEDIIRRMTFTFPKKYQRR